MKKTVTIIIIFLILTLITIGLIFYQPLDILKSLPFLNKLYTNTTLSINSPRGKAKITVDGKDSGQTNQTLNDLPEGKHLVTLSRIIDDQSSKDKFYKETTFPIELTNNSESLINVEIGPDGVNYGYMLYYTVLNSYESEKSYLTVNSPVGITDISLDNVFISTTPVNRMEMKPTSFKLTASLQGYQNVELPIITRKGYNLNVFVYLYPIPVEIISN
jgi:hypothetical protein